MTNFQFRYYEAKIPPSSVLYQRIYLSPQDPTELRWYGRADVIYEVSCDHIM